MSDHHIQFGILIVGSLTFVALVWYAFETMWLRKAAQDQLEALAKPCLTLWADLRDAAGAILSKDHAVGNTIIHDESGHFVVHNIGNGVALNVQYVFRSLDPNGRQTTKEPNYIFNILAGQKMKMPEPVNAYPHSYELVFQFESIGQKTYRSTIKFDQKVLTSFIFEAVQK